MALNDLIPWNRKRDLPAPRREEDPVWALHRQMNRMLDDFGRGFDLAPRSGDGWPFRPTLDLRETDEEIRVTAELPGLEEKDFELNLTGDTLTLRGEKRREHEEREGDVIHRVERAYGAFQRSVSLPCEVEADKAQARFKKGGIIIPDTAKEKPMQGAVMAAGAGKVDEDGKLRPLDVRPGDRVLFGKYAGSEIELEGQEHLIIREDDVLAVLE